MAVKERWILTATILASGMSFLLSTMVSIALPTLQVALGATIDDLQWVVNAYTLSLAVLILISGVLGDHFGRKRIFSYGILVFLIGALVSGLSRGIGQLIAAQAVLGVGAAMMIPGTLSIINSFVPVKRRGRAIGLWAGLAGGISTIGPFLGGWIVETFSWPWLFYFTIPIGLLALFITIRYVPESKNPDAQSIDWLGTLLLGVGLLGASLGLIRGPVIGWNDGVVLLSLAAGIVSLALFFVVEKRTREPLVPLLIFKNKLVLGANIVTFFLYFALFGLIFFLILNMQQFQNWSPTFAGLALLPPFVLITLFSGAAGSRADKKGPRQQMIVGPFLVAVSMSLFLFVDIGSGYLTHFFPGLVLFGIGMALVIAPLTKSALSVDQKFSGLASGVNNAVSRVAALLAIALLGAIVVSVFSAQLADSVSNLVIEDQQLVLDQASKLGAIDISDVEDQNAAQSAINSAFLLAFRWAMGICAFLALLGSGVSALTIPRS